MYIKMKFKYWQNGGKYENGKNPNINNEAKACTIEWEQHYLNETLISVMETIKQNSMNAKLEI